jgi:hypothetical protein
MNTYTPEELVRMEILQYDNPEGLHPVEGSWRTLARKLMQDCASLNKALTSHHGRVPNDGKCFECQLNKNNFIKIPERMV